MFVRSSVLSSVCRSLLTKKSFKPQSLNFKWTTTDLSREQTSGKAQQCPLSQQTKQHTLNTDSYQFPKCVRFEFEYEYDDWIDLNI